MADAVIQNFILIWLKLWHWYPLQPWMSWYRGTCPVYNFIRW